MLHTNTFLLFSLTLMVVALSMPPLLSAVPIAFKPLVPNRNNTSSSSEESSSEESSSEEVATTTTTTTTTGAFTQMVSQMMPMLKQETRFRSCELGLQACAAACRLQNCKTGVCIDRLENDKKECVCERCDDNWEHLTA